MALQDEIVVLVVDTTIGVRKGVGQCSRADFAGFVNTIIKAKQGDLDLATIPTPWITDRVKYGLQAALSAKTKTGVSGGIEWQVIKLSGEYGREQQTGVTVNIDMEFMSVGAPDFEKMKALSVDELKKLLEIVEED